MTVFHGLPSHVFFVHFLIALVPLTALLEIICALWPAVRRGQIVWLVLALAVVTLALTPVTAEAGEWLYGNVRGSPDPILQVHAARGAKLIYSSMALLVAAAALAVLHVAERESERRRIRAEILTAVLVAAVGVTAIVQIYRIGDTGARSVWSHEIAH